MRIRAAIVETRSCAEHRDAALVRHLLALDECGEDYTYDTGGFVGLTIPQSLERHLAKG